MGLIITELKLRQPDLVYFDENFEGNIRKKHRLRFLNWRRSIRPQVKSQKEDEAYKEAAMQATYELQNGRKGYQALLSHI